MPREDAAPVIDALARLRASPDPVVRAASVLQSAHWDAGGAEAILHRGLLDPDARVRHASVSGVIASGARSDRLKDALLAIASDAQLDDERRHAAVMALQDYSLDRAEYAVYGAAAADVVQEH